jgi:hypothetical protein
MEVTYWHSAEYGIIYESDLNSTEFGIIPCSFLYSTLKRDIHTLGGNMGGDTERKRQREEIQGKKHRVKRHRKRDAGKETEDQR